MLSDCDWSMNLEAIVPISTNYDDPNHSAIYSRATVCGHLDDRLLRDFPNGAVELFEIGRDLGNCTGQ
jgi:hypothetical protein